MIIKKIHIIDDLQDFFGDIRVENGKITEIGTELVNDSDVIDFSNKDWVLLPAFTDLHAHFRDPGFTYKEDIESGSKAAIHGGYTAVNLMPNTKPICSSMNLVKDVEHRIEAIGLILAHQTLSMTKNLEGKEYEHLKALQKGEILFVSDDGKGVNDNGVMEEIFKICKKKEIIIMSHAEDHQYSATDMRKAENNMTFRDIELCAKTGGRIHFCHVSTIEAIEAIAKARKQGLNITCEVTPHHIFATGEEVNHYRVNPPFREQKDIHALIKAMQNGMVDAIATDHAPHSEEDKQNGAPGMTGLELAFSLCYTKLVKENHLSLNQLVKLMSTNPSAMMKLNKGKINVGMNADFAIVDLKNPYIIDSAKFFSKGKNTPFNGKKVYGKIIHTIRNGKIY
ncbi:MAG: dihydroorotase [Bacteroidales bacterium]